MSAQVITATEASRSLSDVLNKVHYQHQSFDIKRGKEVIAKIIPATPSNKPLKISELSKLFKRLPSLDESDSQAFENSIKEIRANMKVKGNLWD